MSVMSDRILPLDLRVLKDAWRNDPELLSDYDAFDEEFACARREILNWLAEEKEAESDPSHVAAPEELRGDDDIAARDLCPIPPALPRKLHLSSLARSIGLSAGQMRRILTGRTAVTLEAARSLEQYFHDCRVSSRTHRLASPPRRRR